MAITNFYYQAIAQTVPTSFCGNTICESDENHEKCPSDCAPTGTVCGNGVCDSGETTASCPKDCEDSTKKAVCGDGLCEATYENQDNCPIDCGGTKPPNPYVCGDGRCDAQYGETSAICPKDCLTNQCGDGKCDPSIGETPNTCAKDCSTVEMCGNGKCESSENSANCPADCANVPPSPVCGNNVCEYPENKETCAVDCYGVSTCGNGVCDAKETTASCPKDCGEPYTGYCGDKTCDASRGETAATCILDCHCGNGVCDKNLDETEMSCSVDCHASAPPPAQCADSDGGQKPMVRGAVKDAASTYPDACIDAKTVKEFYCDSANAVRSVAMACGAGFACQSGYCVSTNDSTAECGDGTCAATETAAGCPADCQAKSPSWKCGNGLCEKDLGETTSLCPGDCPTSSLCGNRVCDAGETTASCRVDCYKPVCGDNLCEATLGETSAGCLADCHCGDGLCDATFGETPKNCPKDCVELCGNGVCDGGRGETTTSCPVDCPVKVTQEPVKPCLDSDKGQDPLTVGTTELGLLRYVDSCAGVGEVKEYYCDFGQVKNITIACKDGQVCDQGRCVSASVTQAAKCGNKVCEKGETAASCIADCAQSAPPGSACGDKRCDAASGERYENCPVDCPKPSVDQPPPPVTTVTTLSEQCSAAGITDPEKCRSFLNGNLVASDAAASWRCGDGRCDKVLGESNANCASDCPVPATQALDPRCVEAKVMTVEGCRSLLMRDATAAAVPGVCLVNGIGDMQACATFIKSAQPTAPTLGRPVTTPTEAVTDKVDPRCFEVNITDALKCGDYLKRMATVPTSAVEEAPDTRPAVPPICSENGYKDKGSCELYLKQLYVVPECRAAGIYDQDACRGFLAAKRLPQDCVAGDRLGTVDCANFQSALYLPPICKQAGATSRETCMATVFGQYGRPSRCEKLDDESCWRLIETGNLNDRDYDLRISAATVSDKCIEAGAVTAESCRRLVDSMTVPEECRLNGYYNKPACDKFLFERGSEVSRATPSECVSAGINDGADCDAYLQKIHLPSECAAAGLSSADACRSFLAMKDIPKVCRDAGITSSVECEKQLRAKVTKPACAAIGITDDAACAEMTFRRLASSVSCVGLSAEECAMNVKEKNLGSVVDADERLNRIRTEVAGLADSAGAIDVDRLAAEDPTGAESIEEKLPFVAANNRNLLAVGAEEGLIITDDDRVRVASPILLAIDSDGDGIPDDVERRYGLNPELAETRPGVPDMTAFRQMSLRAGIDQALIDGQPLGHPIAEGEVDPGLSVDTIGANSDGSAPIPGVSLGGRGRVGEVVTIYLYSDLPIVITTTVDENGQWSYSFDDSLSDGVHEVYVAVNDDTGRISRKSEPLAFIVRAAESLGVREALAAESASAVDIAVMPEVNVESGSKAGTSMRWFIIGGALLLLAAAGVVIAMFSSKR